MEKIDLKTLRYLLIPLLFCVVLGYLVQSAYSYLPKTPSISTQPNDYTEENISEENNIEEARSAEPVVREERHGVLYRSEDYYDTEPAEKTVAAPKQDNQKTSERKFEELSPLYPEEDAKSTNFSDDVKSQVSNQTPEEILQIANSEFKAKNYDKSLSLFKQILTTSDDKALKAECYEKMALISAISKRYGTALTYANRANNLVPTSNRELLAARLYYKTGDESSARKYLDSALKREFSQEY